MNDPRNAINNIINTKPAGNTVVVPPNTVVVPGNTVVVPSNTNTIIVPENTGSIPGTTRFPSQITIVGPGTTQAANFDFKAANPDLGVYIN